MFEVLSLSSRHKDLMKICSLSCFVLVSENRIFYMSSFYTYW